MKRGLFIVAALLVACADPAGTGDGHFFVEAKPQSMQLTNGYGQDVHYFMADADQLPLIDWIACVLPTCPHVAARSMSQVPYSQVAGYRTETANVVVYWWMAVPGAGGALEPDSIRSVTVAR